MEFLHTLLSVLDTQMAVPAPYSAFHLFFILASVAAGFMICRYCRKVDEGFIRRFLLIVSLVTIGLEIYKQINYSFQLEGGRITFDYQWYAFPFQFCSTPMYVSLLAAVIRNQKMHKRLCAYLATYSMFAGICVMLYPVSVFIGTVGINIQTMICHGVMVTMGIALLGTGYVEVSLQTMKRALQVFMTLILCAIAMNELAPLTGLLETETFNMFFISRYCDPELPVYSLVQGIVPFPVSVLIYIAGFTTAAFLVMLSGKALRKVSFAAHSAGTLKPVLRRSPLFFVHH